MSTLVEVPVQVWHHTFFRDDFHAIRRKHNRELDYNIGLMGQRITLREWRTQERLKRWALRKVYRIAGEHGLLWREPVLSSLRDPSAFGTRIRVQIDYAIVPDEPGLRMVFPQGAALEVRV